MCVKSYHLEVIRDVGLFCVLGTNFSFSAFCAPLPPPPRSDDDMPTAGMEVEGRRLEGEEEEEEEEVPRINVEIPCCTAHLGSELYFVKLPNFLSVETR